MRIFGATLVVIAVTVGIFVSATNKENPTAIATAGDHTGIFDQR